MGEVIVLDVRELEHPIPFEKAIKTFATMADDDMIHMIHRKNPLPLYEFLDKQEHAAYRYEQDDAGVWHIFIRKNVKLA